MTALQHANQVRSARAAIREQVRAGQVHVLDAIRDPRMDTMRAAEALRWTPYGTDGRRTAPYVVRQWLQAAGATEMVACGHLTERQHRVLREVIPS
jgi:hypothetical protein